MNHLEIRARSTVGRKSTAFGVAINVVLAFIKISSGILGHSYALVADGVESILDVLSAMVVWGGLKIAARPPDRNHPYGHARAESIAALLVALVLIIAAVGIAIESVREILTPHHAPAAFTLFVLLGVIGIKEGLFRFLNKIGRSIESTAMQVDAWHHRSDAMTSAAAFIGISIALVGGKGYESADDWFALLACGIIAYNGYRLSRAAISELMDEAPDPEIENRIRAVASEMESVEAFEKCRVRKSGFGYFVELHVIVDGEISVREGHDIAHKVKSHIFAAGINVFDVLVHVEPQEVGAREGE